MDDPDKEDPLTPYMDICKSIIQSDGSLDKLTLIILFRVYVQNKEMIVYTWYPTSQMRALKYLLEYYSKHKSGLHQLYFIGEFIQDNVKHRFF